MRTGVLRMIVYSPEGATVTMQSPRTLRDNTRVVPGLTQAQYEDWLKGRGLVQNIMPHVSAEDREFLMTGYTPEDWAAIFPPEEDEG